MNRLQQTVMKMKMKNKKNLDFRVGTKYSARCLTTRTRVSSIAAASSGNGDDASSMRTRMTMTLSPNSSYKPRLDCSPRSNALKGKRKSGTNFFRSSNLRSTNLMMRDGGSFVVPAQTRTLFIRTEQTPNPAANKFLPGTQVLSEEYGSGLDFTTMTQARMSPLAKRLLRVPGVTGVFLGRDFVTVNKTDEYSWTQIKPQVFSILMDYFGEGSDQSQGIIDEEEYKRVKDAEANEESEVDDDDEIVQLIKEILEERVRPAVQEDGGDITLHSWDEDTGTVRVVLSGSCTGCPSSTVTLKAGVENMLMHYIPEVESVEQVIQGEEEQ